MSLNAINLRPTADNPRTGGPIPGFATEMAWSPWGLYNPYSVALGNSGVPGYSGTPQYQTTVPKAPGEAGYDDYLKGIEDLRARTRDSSHPFGYSPGAGDAGFGAISAPQAPTSADIAANPLLISEALRTPEQRASITNRITRVSLPGGGFYYADSNGNPVNPSTEQMQQVSGGAAPRTPSTPIAPPPPAQLQWNTTKQTEAAPYQARSSTPVFPGTLLPTQTSNPWATQSSSNSALPRLPKLPTF